MTDSLVLSLKDQNHWFFRKILKSAKMLNLQKILF